MDRPQRYSALTGDTPQGFSSAQVQQYLTAVGQEKSS